MDLMGGGVPPGPPATGTGDMTAIHLESPPGRAPSSRLGARVLTSAFIGTTIEWYDFYLYGTAAALVFDTQFFPTHSAVAGTLGAFATFSVGFIARPVGGIIAGHLGD